MTGLMHPMSIKIIRRGKVMNNEIVISFDAIVQKCQTIGDLKELVKSVKELEK